MLLGLIVLAQPAAPDELHLAVKGDLNDRILHFKPGKRLKLKTTTGEVIYTWNYSINDDHVLTEKNQMIYYNDIVRIKGRVMKDTGRVAAGALLLTTGVFLVGSTIAIATLALTPGLTLQLLAIEAGIIVGGARMLGHRTFRTNKGWEIQTYPAGE